MPIIQKSRGGGALAWLALAWIASGVLIEYPRVAIAAEQKVALVIGNSAYPSSRLRNPVNDAKAMADKLRALGFEVILRTDSNLREMTRSFSEFGRKVVPGSVSLFYYAGHGMQVRGRNFLIPVDAEIDNEASVRSEAVDVEQILDHLGSAKLSMVILDACRNNPFERRIRSGAGSGLAQIDAPTGTLLAYATAPGKVAADGNGSNGLYTTELLRAIDTPGLKIEDVFKQVRVSVLKASNDQQIPWESSSLTSEFYFRPGTVSAGIDTQERQQAAKVQAELQKALLEERKKYEREAESVKAEMEKLRAELLKFKAEAEPEVTQVALQTGGSPAPQTQTNLASAAAKATQTTAAQSSSSTGSTSPATAAQWAERIALLEKFRDELSFSKAIAILLNINATEELSMLLVHQRQLEGMKQSSAYAMGNDQNGNPIWGAAYSWSVVHFAAESAIELCQRSPGDSCKAIVVNGEFRQKEFFELARIFGKTNVATARQAYMQSIRNSPLELRIPIAGSTRDQGYAFASIRK